MHHQIYTAYGNFWKTIGTYQTAYKNKGCPNDTAQQINLFRHQSILYKPRLKANRQFDFRRQF